ncbi:UDP-glucose 4-epimerase GalE [Novosphingobium aquae]|uniref:UDP-glucose 4-epimerase n=1 Tax=Novosphingobium aquae TaxID=3133435 RepID=A0ABU8SE72_9SPHN
MTFPHDPPAGAATGASRGTVLVTGGAGYVGSHCCQAFVKAGWNVVVFDNLSRGWRDFVRWGPLIEGDILDADALARAFAEVKPDAVAHFAALAYVGESVDDPGLYYRTNACGTLNLLEAMVAAGVPRLVFSSTCATYGEPQLMPIGEDCPQSPVNPYGWSKLIVERMLADFDRAHGLKSVALRYFNAAGADPGGAIGERHAPETHLIPLAIRAAERGGDFALTVFGDDFATPDGTCIRDYIHVADLAEAHLAALAYLVKGGATTALNLGTGQGHSVRQVIDTVARLAGRLVRHSVGSRRVGDPPELVADPSRAAAVLGWQARRPGLDAILGDALAWHERERQRQGTAV